jgi:hypothetical protein
MFYGTEKGRQTFVVNDPLVYQSQHVLFEPDDAVVTVSLNRVDNVFPGLRGRGSGEPLLVLCRQHQLLLENDDL